MTDQLAFPWAPNPKRTRAPKWGGVGQDPEKRRKQARKWRKENPEKRNAAKQRWRDRNPAKVKAQAARQYLNNKDRHKKTSHRNKLKKYALTVPQFTALLETQGHGCAICRQPFAAIKSKMKSPCVDHHHGTGRVRGLLCHPCNSAIGLFREDPELLRAAAAYIAEGRDAL